MKLHLEELLKDMKQKVYMQLYVAEITSPAAKRMMDFLKTIAELNDKLSLEVINHSKLEAVDVSYKIERVPMILLLDDERNYHRVKYYGIPAGHEVQSLIQGILAMSGAPISISDELLARVKSIQKKVTLKVFVTLGCPHCPQAVHKAHQIAMLNENVTAEMIDAEEFYEYSSLYNVSSVPQIVINDKFNLIGNVPLSLYLDEIEKL